MASTEHSSAVLKTKFRGCLMGASVGDCLGVPFEFRDFYFVGGTFVKIFLPPSKEKLTNFMTDVLNEESTKFLHYTDDTTMTKGVASSLVDKGEVDAKDMAKKFVDAYFKEGRSYGSHVRLVFHKLKESEFADIFKPASEQFNGSGSFGNGAAMRTAPIALFGHNKREEFIINAAKECSLITHAHPNGYRGCILQCLAVHAALRLDSSQEFDPVSFINNLLKKMKKIETGKEKPYCDKLEKMKTFFRRDDVSSEKIADCLGNGNDASALRSVPTAIYSFIRGMKPLKFKESSGPKYVPSAIYAYFNRTAPKTYFESSNPFLRTIFFAVSVGGDTDTIGCMAGAIAGAYYGEDVIPDVVRKKCELIEEVASLADKLFEVVTDRNKILWPKPNRNRISATILVSAETENRNSVLQNVYVYKKNTTKLLN